MSNEVHCVLTTADYAVLEKILDGRVQMDSAVPALLRGKLSSAMIVFSDDVPPAVATLNSQVTFRVNGGPADTRTLVADDTNPAGGPTLSVWTTRGAALLGLEVGDSVTVTRDGVTETVRLHAVSEQPEAAARAKVLDFTRARRASFSVVPSDDGDGDDPGPRAA